MPIANIQDAHEVQRGLQTILTAPDADGRARAIRTLFVETLDFDHADVLVTLGAAKDPNLPPDAHLLTRRGGFSVLYIPLEQADDNRVKTTTASAAAKVIGDQIADEPLLLFTNRDCDELHIIYPDLSGSRPRLQRMVAHRGKPARTVIQQIANLWRDYGVAGKTIGEAIRNAFSVQPVTDAFFRDYKDAYDAAVDLIATSVERTDAEQFTQTLFNRLLFVHFVSHKGWLHLNGDTDYLNALWRNYQADPKATNFYTDRLTTLFFQGLNNPEPKDQAQRDNPLIGHVPFLNGGLFEETGLDRHAEHAVPDAAIEPMLHDGSEPGLFNRYNFTVTEATPLDTEVAVDPEMLGKLFEETVNERNSNGAYYTPRPVVTFMCREAIKGYLSGRNIPGLDDDQIANLVDNRDPDAITPDHAPKIYDAVKNMKAVDPACGSGAFLLGMMQEILALNDSLFRATNTSDSLYNQKLGIISNNIYGTDKDGLAVSTAMLRLWLSLAVDYDGDGTPAPLPNLEMKLVVGDAVAGHSPKNDAVQNDLGKDLIAKSNLQKYIVGYTTAYGPEKDEFKKQVEDEKERLRKSIGNLTAPGAVEWRIDFADVILNGGFDVVIANPPYVQLQRNSGELANLYQNVGYATFARTGDIYQLFYERGFQLLKADGGLLAYITSNSWLKSEYGKSTRRYFTERHTPLYLLELGKDVFESAIVDSCVLVARSGHHDATARAVDLDKVSTQDFPPAAEHWGELRPYAERPWSVLTPVERNVMDKMLAAGTPLKDWDVAMYRGLTTGLNEAFVIDDATRQTLINADAKSAEIIKPMLRGRDIQRYRANWAGLWMINVPWHFPLHQDSSITGVSARAEELFKKQYPAVFQHLLAYKVPLAARNKSETGIRYEWYALQRWAANYHDEFTKEKLFWMDLTEQGRFAYDPGNTFCVNTVFMMTGPAIKYLCAVLNSKLTTWFMGNTALNSGMGVTRWIGHTVEQIPIPQISAAHQRPFIQLVDRILAAKAADPAAKTSDDEAEIDRLVYELYGLTEKEMASIAGK